MNRNITDVNVAADAKAALRFWENHPNVKLHEATCAQFKKAQAAFEEVAERAVQKEAELRLQLTERDRLGRNVRFITSRLRSAIRGIYGPDSKEYEQVGGTRTSARKRPVRRKVSGLIEATNGNGAGSRSIAMVH